MCYNKDMNYYDLDKINKSIRKELYKKKYYNEYIKLPTLAGNLQERDDIILKFSNNKTYISEESLFPKLIEIKKFIKKENIDIDFNNINILDCLLESDCISPTDHFIDYRGSLRKGELKKIKIEVQKEFKFNPYYHSVKNLIELKENKEKCISMDFEFSGKFGITEFGVSFVENGQKVTKLYKIKKTPSKKIESNFTNNVIYIDINKLKELIKKYTKDFDAFIFHDKNSEKILMRTIFGTLKSTPFNGKKKIIDTVEISKYMKERDKEYSESGFDNSLTGVSKYFNLNPENMHNASNDSRYTFDVAELFFSKYEKKIKYYNERKDKMEPEKNVFIKKRDNLLKEEGKSDYRKVKDEPSKKKLTKRKM